MRINVIPSKQITTKSDAIIIKSTRLIRTRRYHNLLIFLVQISHEALVNYIIADKARNGLI